MLLLHEAHRVDPARFVAQVFLPWVRLRRTLQPNWQRVGREMARIGEVAEGSVEETEHQIALYRLIVSDLFDPYITILASSCELIAGTFTDLDAANFKMGEVNKVEVSKPISAGAATPCSCSGATISGSGMRSRTPDRMATSSRAAPSFSEISTGGRSRRYRRCDGA